MPGRFTKPLSPMGKEWDAPTRARIYEQFRALEAGMSGLQGTPDDPTTIIAGDVVIPEPNQTPAPSNHTHPIETAAPSVKVAFGGTASEGASTSLTRSDATHILEVGTVDEQTLMWKTNTWVPTPLEDYDVLVWMGI